MKISNLEYSGEGFIWNNFSPSRAPEQPTWATLRNGKQIEYSTIYAIKEALKSWSPFTPTLVSRPFCSVFTSPISHQELSPLLHKKYKAAMLPSLVMISTATIALLYFCLKIQNKILWNYLWLAFTVMGTIFYDYILCSSDDEVIKQRSLFSYWFVNSPAIKKGAFLWLSFLICIGASQFVLEHIFGGLDNLLQIAGATHKEILTGEIWRLVVGPLWHSSLAHYINNFAMLMFIGPLAWALFQYKSFAIFAAGNLIGAITSTANFALMPNYPFDCYGGISSGAYALFGFLIGVGLRKKTILPSGAVAHLFGIVVISGLSAQFLTSNSAITSHLIGFFAGTVFGIMSHIGRSKTT